MTVYLIRECGGSYEDCWEQIIKCFSDVKLAEEFAKSKNEYYNYIESFRNDLIGTHDLFNVLMDKYWFNRPPMIDKISDHYPMNTDNSIFKNCVKETFPELWEKYTEKTWDNIWEYYMKDDDKIQNSNKYCDSYLRYFVQPIQVENSL